MTGSILKIADKLKNIIDENGPGYLADNPYEAFLKLTESGATDRRTASAVLCLLVSGMLDEIGKDRDSAELSKQIQKECSFNKKMSEDLANIFLSVFSAENEKEWKEKELEGWKQFLDDEFKVTWEGFALWDYGDGTVSCHYKAEIILMPTEKSVIDRALAQKLKKNPFLTKEFIASHYREKLEEYLDDDFEDYCTCDDYYQPCVEDFMADRDPVSEWCKDNGFELIDCDGEGYDDGYEPRIWKGTW